MPVDLFESVTECGCAAKVPAQDLVLLLRGIAPITDPNVLVGPETLDDAGVYRLSHEHCLVQTLDFFPPVARDPFEYGRIAAANSLSDVYAMGGRPLTALAIVCCPSPLVTDEVLGAMTRGASEKLHEAGCVLLGGHSVLDPQLKFGLSITGIVQADKLFDNASAKPGDVLFLTKPLGTGVTVMAIRAAMASEDQEKEANRCMATLNGAAAQLASRYAVRCVTDVTGFGLLGHAVQMAKASDVGLEIHKDKVALLDGVRGFAELGLLSAAAYNNRAYIGDDVLFQDPIDLADRDLLFDPQTSGGLLVCCPVERADAFEAEARTTLTTAVSRIGVVQQPHPDYRIAVRRGQHP